MSISAPPSPSDQSSDDQPSSDQKADGSGDNSAGLTPAALFYILIAYVLVSNLDASAKWLGFFIPVLQIVWVRMTLHGVYGLIFARAWQNPKDFVPNHPILQIIRGLLLMAATIFNFFAIQYLQLAQAIAIFFLSPFLVTIMAGPFLGEWAGLRRWAAIVAGFAGALIVIQPGMSGFHPAMILSLGSALSFSIYLIITRKIAFRENAQVMTIMPALVGGLLLAPVGLWVWEPIPNLWTLFILLSLGFWGYAGHFFIVKAHQLAPATILAPFHYTQILSMAGLGYLIFGDVPGPATVLGSAVIVASGLYLWWRESVAKRSARKTP